jgi:hypothetical protein
MNKDVGHSDQPSTSKSNNKKRKSDCSIANVERSCHNKEYQPQLGEYESILEQICIFHPRESTRPRTVTDCKAL